MVIAECDPDGMAMKIRELQAKLIRVQNSFLDLTAEANEKEDVISNHVAEIKRLTEYYEKTE